MGNGADSASDQSPSTPVDEQQSTASAEAPVATDRDAGEPIAAQATDAAPAEEPTDPIGSSVPAVAASVEAIPAEEMITSDADFAEPPLLPASEAAAEVAEVTMQAEPHPAGSGDAVEEAASAENVVTEDADLAYTAEDAVSVADDADQGEPEASIVAEDEGGDDSGKGRKKRRKKARKVAKRALAAETSQMAAHGSFADALPFILTGRLNTVLAQLGGVRADEDPEAVHDMRVATRRLRAALVAAEPFYGRKRYRAMARSVRDLTRALGQVRDADVLLSYLRERYMTVATDERIGLEGLIDAIAADRAVARDDLDPVLDAWGEDGDLATEFVQSAAKVKARGRKAKSRDQVALVAARALDRDVDQFMDHAELLDDEGGSAEAFHDLRIAGKKLRYTIELFAPVLDSSADDLLAGLKSLQELLGEIHDRDVLIDLLSWERARALERQLHSLEFATFNPGTRDERLRAARQVLDAPDSFAATAIGIYGLLIDATIERDALEEGLRERWRELQAAEFIARFHDLAESLSAPSIEHEDDEASDTTTAEAEAE